MELKPVGVVHTKSTEEQIRFDHENFEAQVEVYPEYADGLDGLRGFSHIFILAYLHKLRPEQMGVLKVKPRRLLTNGFKINELPLVGVFALSSPSRPNPLGLSLVELLKVDDRYLTVKGLDYFDGTPVLDIKPYNEHYRVDTFREPNWYSSLRERAGESEPPPESEPHKGIPRE